MGERGTRAVDELIASAQGAEREGRRAEARQLYERALYALDAETAPLASSLLRWIGRSYQIDADPEAALECLEAAIAVAALAGDEGALGHAINVQAIVHWQQGELDAAEQLYSRAREHALRAGDLRLAAMTAGNLGVIANIRGDLERTQRFYTTSLEEFRAVGQPQEICAALNNMGMLYADLGEWTAAEQAYDEAVQIAEVLGEIGALITLDGNRAEMYLARGELARAREAAEKAVALSRQTNDRRAMGELEKHLGAIAREEGDHERAQRHLDAARELAEERHDLLLLAETCREHAELHRRLGRNREALTHLNRAHRLFEQLRAKRDLADVGKRTRRMEGHFLEVIRHWGESIESKDRYTKGHCDRVADLACALAARAGLDPHSLFFFRIGALIHDVGKLVIPSEVLNKPGPLTADEWELVRRHPAAGVAMVADIEFPEEVIEIVRSHHERWDGRGYPDGLEAEAIPRSARILCIADVYDALTSVRSYKAAMSPAEALETMRRDVGRQFDPELFVHFEELMSTRLTQLRPRAPGSLRREAIGDTISAARGARDDLTGVLLRRSLVDAASALLVEREARESVSLLVIDIDEFKAVNDTYGHLQGDDVLRIVAAAVKETVGQAGLIGRYAGDEFVAVLPRCAIDEAAQLGERIRVVVRELPIQLRERSGALTVTLSIGVAAAEAARDQFEAVFARADRALYEAKRRGRDAVVTSNEVADGAPEPTIHLRHFVGRVAESGRLVRLLEATIGQGAPAAVAVVGEAGVGKSTLVRQLLPEVRLRAGSLVSGACVEADVKPPYAAWAEVIAAIHKLGIVAGREWRELPRLVPALGSPSEDHGGGNKYALFDEIASYLRIAAATRPLVVMLDDMQWADASTWDVLEHVLGQLADDRLMLCLTVRLEDERGEALERRRRLSRDERFHEIHLQRLTLEELETWLARVFVGSEVSAELLPFLHEYSEGNPLLASQLLRMLLDDGAIRQMDGTWKLRAPQEVLLPAAITGLMERRLARLSPRTRRILTTAAAIGREFDVDVLAAAEGCSEDELLDALEEGEAVAVLEPTRDDGTSTASFAHSLLVQAALRAATGRRVARVHERIAAALVEYRPTSVAEIARHYDRAGNAAQAHVYALRAGATSVSVYAYEEARRFFAIAERCARTPAERAAAALRLVEVAEAEGHYADGEALCERGLDESDGQVPPELSLRLRRLRERLRAQQGQPPGRTIFACRALLVEANSRGLKGEVVALLSLISQSYTRLADWAEAEAVARDCVAAAEGTEDARLVAEALTRLGTALMDNRPAEATALYDRAHSLFAQIGDRCGQARCLINLGIVHSRQRHATEAEEAYARALATARAAHASDLVALASLNLGVLHVRRGEADRGDEAFREALHLFAQINSEPLRLATLYNLAHLDRERARYTQAITLYDEVIAVAARTGQPDVEVGARAGMALALLGIGRTGEAAEAADTIAARLEQGAEWWIQGREIIDALRVRLALSREAIAEATALFYEGVRIAGRHDPYAAAWLVAECAAELRLPGPELTALIAPHAAEATTQGYGALVARFTAINSGARPGGSGNAIQAA